MIDPVKKKVLAAMAKDKERVTKKEYLGTIDITPSWSSLVVALIDLAHHDKPNIRADARSELVRMAEIADLYNAKA